VCESWTEDGRRVYGERMRRFDWRGGKDRMSKPSSICCSPIEYSHTHQIEYYNIGHIVESLIEYKVNCQ
jgi:hypothetical protein